MSWSIKVIGKPADVKAAILKDAHMPKSLKDTVALFADAGSANKNQPGAIEVDTSGHYDPASGYSNIYKFSINPVVLAPPAPSTETTPVPAAPIPDGEGVGPATAA